MIQQALHRLLEHESLTRDEAQAVMEQIMEGRATPAQIGGFLVALRIKGETEDEMAGFATAMRAHAVPVPVGADRVLVDTCGTGGDGRHTFNISTTAAFVAAGAGVSIAKHGNRAISGACGSADVLEALGVNIQLGPEAVARCLDEAGVGFMFAPLYHPAMRHAGPVRRELGVRTVFNLLGPLTNPAGANTQLLGVADPKAAPILARALARLGTRRALVVHGDGGLDEISLSGPTTAYEVRAGEREPRQFTIHPADLGLALAPVETVRGGTAAENADRVHAVLACASGPYRDIVLLNAAAVLYVAGQAADLHEGLALAAAAIDSGSAAAALARMVAVSQGHAPALVA
jgi:anthranilate phosphoribosyltransferase